MEHYPKTLPGRVATTSQHWGRQCRRMIEYSHIKVFTLPNGPIVVSLVKNHFFHFYYGRFRLHVSFACGIIQRCSQTNFSNSIYTNLAELAPFFSQHTEPMRLRSMNPKM
jgi:hypothetical protein